jgi:competence protein ComEC
MRPLGRRLHRDLLHSIITPAQDDQVFISEVLHRTPLSAGRQIVETRVCAIATAFLCGGILIGRYVPVPDPSWTLVCLIPALVFLWAATRPQQVHTPWEAGGRPPVTFHAAGRGTAFLLGTGTFLLTLGFHITANEMRVGADFETSMESCSIYATVSKTLGTAEGYRILLMEDGYNHSEHRALPGYGRLLLRDNGIALSAGDRIAFRSRVRLPLNRDNPGEFDWASYCRNDGIMWLVSVSGPERVLLIGRGFRWRPSAILFDVRESMRLFLDAHSGRYVKSWVGRASANDARTFLKGIILGDRSEIGYSVRSTFADSGLAHALSASGVHVAIVVLLTVIAVNVVTRAMPGVLLWTPSRKIAAFVSIPVMVMYCMLVGASAPAVRSTIMGVVFAVAILANRRGDSFNSLIVAAFLILLLYPLSLFAKDFQLSFVAVAGILLVAPPLLARMKERLSPHRDPAEGSPLSSAGRLYRRAVTGSVVVAGTSLGATLAVTPLVLQSFHSFPVYTLLANLLADTLLTIALFFGLCGSVMGPVSPDLGALVLIPADVCSLLTIKLAAAISAIPYSTLKVRHLMVPEYVALWAAVCCAMWVIREPGKSSLTGLAAALCGVIVTVTISSWHNEPPAMRVTFLNVGKADAALVEPRGSRGLLIDGGLRNDHFDSGPSIVLPFLWWNGNRTLDGMIVSHPQMDHMGGLLSVIPYTRPGCLWWNPVEPCPRFMTLILAEARKAGSLILPADRNRPAVSMGTAMVRFLTKPCSTDRVSDHNDLNNASVACSIRCGRVCFLFTGDLEASGEEELVASGIPLAAHVLKVGHHGSRTSTSRGFVEAVRPKVAVISADYRSTRGGPAKDVVERLQSAGSTVYWTGRDGAVTVETDGTAVSVRTGRGKETR